MSNSPNLPSSVQIGDHKLSFTKDKKLVDYLPIALDVFAVTSFLLCLISCFSASTKHWIFIAAYLSILLYHGIRIYLAATNKSFFSKKQPNDQLLKRIWLGRHIHIFIFTLTLFVFGAYPFLFFVAYILYCIRKVVVVIQKHIGPRLGDQKQTVDNLAKTIRDNQYILHARGFIDILLQPYLFLAFLFTFRGNYFVAFIVYFLNNLLYGMMADAEQKWAYSQIDALIRNTVKDKNELKNNYNKTVTHVSKVKDVAKKIYPIPQNPVEAVQAAANRIAGN